MVRHIVMWNLNEGFTDEEKKFNLEKIKRKLEELKGLIEGVISLEVIINPLVGSNKDVILNSLFESEETLNHYQTHPEHIRVGGFIKSVTCNRVCFDYVEDTSVKL